MLVLKPIVHETIWGGPRIAVMTGADSSKIGHLYSVYCREGISNEILNGPWKGKHLNQVFSQWRVEFGMDKYQYFPLTIAITEADDNLSIQVHPDDVVANTLEHLVRGKRESWVFLQAPSAGYIYNGCLCGSEQEKAAFLKAGKYLDMADKLPVSAGDYVFVEPGTLHSITAGSLVYEIEEGADTTYRFYDFNRVDADGRPRELHVEKASVALNVYKKSCVMQYCDAEWIEEETYMTRRLENSCKYKNESNTVECFTLIDGHANCGGVNAAPGMTVILWPTESVEGVFHLAFVSRLREGV